MLPAWFNPDNLQTILSGSVLVLAVVAVLAARFIRKVIVKVVMLIVLAAVAGAVWLQRDQLSECAATCECQLFGFDVAIPEKERLATCTGS